MDEYKEITEWLKSSGQDKQYNIELQEDTFMGNLYKLFSVFNNGCQSFIMLTADINQIKTYIESR